jgi:hypothetical protein
MAQSLLEIIFRTKKTGDGEKQAVSGLSKLKDGAVEVIEGLTGMSLASITAAGAIVGLGAGLMECVNAAAEAEQIEAQLNAVLESTRGAAGMTADELTNLAAELADLTAVEDDTIVKAEAIMLTFTKIGKETFPGAMEAALNMSAALGQDLQGSVTMLGKALNDPIQGITALRRVGVAFTEDQMEMIKALVETGDVLSAQKMILAELNTEFGGAAEAMANTYPGKVQKLQNALGNLGEEIGADLLPVLSVAVDKLYELITMPEKRARSFEKQMGEINLLSGTYEAYAKAVRKAAEENGYVTREVDGQIRVFQKHNSGMRDVTEQLGILNRTQWEGQDAARAYSERLTAQAEALLGTGEAALEAASEMDVLSQRFADLKTIIGGEFGKEIKDFNDKMGDLRQKSRDLYKQIKDLEERQYLTAAQKEELEKLRDEYGETKEAIQDLADEHDEAMRRMAFNMLMERAASDGMTENELANLTAIGQAWGLFDQKTAEVIRAVNENMGELDTDSPQHLLSILERILGLPSKKEFEFTIKYEEIGNARRWLGAGADVPQKIEANGTAGFIVPSGYPNDTFLMGFSSGERVVVENERMRLTGSATEDRGVVIHIQNFNAGSELDYQESLERLVSELQRRTA